jgi:hypothetical protein
MTVSVDGLTHLVVCSLCSLFTSLASSHWAIPCPYSDLRSWIKRKFFSPLSLCLPQTLDGVAHREVLSLLLWRMFSIWQICWEVKSEGQDKTKQPGPCGVEACRSGGSYGATTNRSSVSIRRGMVTGLFSALLPNLSGHSGYFLDRGVWP